MDGIAKLGLILMGAIGVTTLTLGVIMAKYGFMTGLSSLAFLLSAILIYNKSFLTLYLGVIGVGYLISLPLGYLFS